MGNSRGVSVLLGNGNGTFNGYVASTTKHDFGHSLAVGDVNGDGKSDLVVANYEEISSVSVLLGNGDGTFRGNSHYLTSWGWRCVALGDFNADSKPDLVVADGSSASVMLGHGDGTFETQVEYATGSGTDSVAVGDFNADGNMDVAAANFSSSTRVNSA